MKRKRTARFYTDVVQNRYKTLPFSDAKHTIQVPMTPEALMKSRPGISSDCWIVHAVMENKHLFPHLVAHVHVTRSTVQIVDRYCKGEPSHTIRYVHPFSKLLQLFDKMKKRKFTKYWMTDMGGKTLTLTLQPRPERHGEGGYPRHSRETNTLKKVMSRGALQRAKDAGFIILPDQAA
jgi:hypothetical protein